MENLPVSSKDVICPTGMPAFIAKPSKPGRYPIVVILHERYGLVPHTRDLAAKCARDGFVVIAPNFFFRAPDQKALNAGEARYAFTDTESLELIADAIATIEKDPSADPTNVAVAGYCQTGRNPLVFAAQNKIAAAVCWYGAAGRWDWPINANHDKPLDEIIAAVDCPVFGAFGAADHLISVDDVRQFRDTLEKTNKNYDIHIYADAPHGWLNDTMPGRYRAPQAEAGWSDQQLFLKTVFGGGYRSGHIQWSFASDIAADYDFSKQRRLE